VRILVTGASGHVGGAIAAHLMSEDHEVVGLGRRPTERLTGSNQRLSSAIAADLGRPGVARTLAADERRCDAIVHAAASLELDPHSPAISLTNGLGSQQMVELATRWDVASFVYISSVPVIGRPLQLPVTEEHPASPATPYHASKLFGEHLVAIAGRAGTRTVSLRLTAPVGPGMASGRILPAFVRQALAGERLAVAGRGTRGQDYVDVRDVAAAVAASLQQRATGRLNIASGRCVTNLELASLCVQAVGSSSEITLGEEPDPDDDVRWEVSIARAERTIGYRPRRSLADSIQAVADQLRERAAT
jgi:dTDP-glucose 4,6-dehydratase